MRKALSTHSFPYPLFELLSHLAKDPGRKWSVTELAADFNTGQPGISKRLQNLLGRGLITVANDPDDKRRKWHWINSHGMRLLDKLESSFADECASLFEGWTTYEVEVLHSLLGRLKGTLEQRLSDES